MIKPVIETKIPKKQSFRVQFFGGAVDVVAREYVVEKANEALQATAAPPRV
jgi:hypothetical protein